MPNNKELLSRPLAWLAVLAAMSIFGAVSLYLTQILPRGANMYGPLMAFFVSLSVCILITWPRTINQTLTLQLNRFAVFLRNRMIFRSDAAIELPKFVIIRVLFGALLIQRMSYALIRMPSYDWLSFDVYFPMLATTILGILLVLGIGTQLVLAILITWDWQIMEKTLSMSTLGNDIAAMLAFFLIFANAGAHYSIDAKLRKKPQSLIGRAIRASYFEGGIPPDNVLQIVKFMIITSYWLVCLYSLSMHLSESAWMTGIAGPHLLANNFMSRFTTEVVWFLGTGGFAVLLARVSLWAMLPWYALVMPALFMGQILRSYVIIWGVLFFSLSLFVLQLGWLAEFELLFWAGLFIGPALLRKRKDVAVAYDDRCNLCDRTISIITAIDIFGRVTLRPVSKSKDFLEKQGVAVDQAMKDLYGFEHGNSKHYSGYNFYEFLSRKLVLLWIAYPILLFGRMSGLGPIIYRFIADRRTKLFGVCELPKPKTEGGIEPGEAGNKNFSAGSLVPAIFIHWLFLSFVYAYMMPAPFIGHSGFPVPSSIIKQVRNVTSAAHVYGVAPINVFNRTDLGMAENWFTLSYRTEAGEEYLVPVFTEAGERLDLHKSDRVYFGTTLPFRRHTIGKEGCHFSTYEAKMRYLTDHKYEIVSIPQHFIYRQYKQPLPSDTDVLSGIYRLQEPQLVCEETFK